MDGLTFVSEIIKALAWPSTIIVIIYLLKKPIIEFLPFMKKLKYKELELEFSQEVMALKAEVSETPTLEIDKADNLTLSTSKAFELVSFSTRAAIMESWIELETAAVEVASSLWNQSSSEAMRNIPRLAEYLHKSKIIDDKQLSIFQRLRQLRNKAAHAEELHLSEEDAKTYIIMASSLVKHLHGK
jgi:hypothetical protein